MFTAAGRMHNAENIIRAESHRLWVLLQVGVDSAKQTRPVCLQNSLPVRLMMEEILEQIDNKVMVSIGLLNRRTRVGQVDLGTVFLFVGKSDVELEATF